MTNEVCTRKEHIACIMQRANNSLSLSLSLSLGIKGRKPTREITNSRLDKKRKNWWRKKERDRKYYTYKTLWGEAGGGTRENQQTKESNGKRERKGRKITCIT